MQGFYDEHHNIALNETDGRCECESPTRLRVQASLEATVAEGSVGDVDNHRTDWESREKTESQKRDADRRKSEKGVRG